jgi:hypothetical protein
MLMHTRICRRGVVLTLRMPRTFTRPCSLNGCARFSETKPGPALLPPGGKEVPHTFCDAAGGGAGKFYRVQEVNTQSGDNRGAGFASS